MVLVIDRRCYGVWLGDQQLPVTPKEFELLAALVDAEGKLVTNDRLADALWDTAPARVERCLQVHVATLRKKLDGVSTIVNQRNLGYRIVLSDDVTLVLP
ncbi:MAG: winged helix-turn-helix domain-containing protein [Acidimicrobiia bacterium]